jgi:hypothetical protein
MRILCRAAVRDMVFLCDAAFVWGAMPFPVLDFLMLGLIVLAVLAPAAYARICRDI